MCQSKYMSNFTSTSIELFCVLFEISFHCEMVTLLLPIPIYLPSRSWLLEKQTTLALVVIPQGFFSLRFYRLILCQMIPIQLLAAIMINFDWMKADFSLEIIFKVRGIGISKFFFSWLRFFTPRFCEFG